ncbi:MAG: aspartyl protease family protein [Bacteroidota bacterium]
MTRLLKLFYYCLLLLFSEEVSAQAFGFQIDNDANKATIRFETYNNLIVVPVVLNNAIPLRFIVDTGVNTAILTDKLFSDILSIEYGKKISLLGADGKREVNAYVARNVSLRLPGVTGKSQSVLVLEEDYLNLGSTIGTEIHGIIGYELFRRFVVELNYNTKTMVLKEPHAFNPKKKYTEVDISLEDTKPYITSDVTLQNGETIAAKFMFDTGASHAILLNMGADERIDLPETHLPRLLGKGLGGDIDGCLGRVEKVKLKHFEIENPIISFANEESYHNLFKSTSRQGSIGGGLISRFNVVIDYFRGKLYLKKNRKFNDPFDYNMSGIEITAEGKKYNEYIVHSVADNSPGYEAGVKKGDRIISINSYPATNYSLGAMNTLLMKKENKNIKLVIKREEEQIKTTFRLEKIL